MKKIYIVRHGEIANPSPRRFVGQLDLPLSKSGKIQIEKVAQFLRHEGIERLLTSPLLRCRESAAIIGGAAGCYPEVDSSFCEINLGEWEGLTRQQIEERFPGEYQLRGLDIASYRIAGGESFLDLDKRVWPAFLKLLNFQEERIALIAHAGVNRILLCRLLNMPLASLFSFQQEYACVNLVVECEGAFHLQLMNYHPEAE